MSHVDADSMPFNCAAINFAPSVCLQAHSKLGPTYNTAVLFGKQKDVAFLLICSLERDSSSRQCIEKVLCCLGHPSRSRIRTPQRNTCPILPRVKCMWSSDSFSFSHRNQILKCHCCIIGCDIFLYAFMASSMRKAASRKNL